MTSGVVTDDCEVDLGEKVAQWVGEGVSSASCELGTWWIGSQLKVTKWFWVDFFLTHNRVKNPFRRKSVVKIAEKIISVLSTKNGKKFISKYNKWLEVHKNMANPLFGNWLYT